MVAALRSLGFKQIPRTQSRQKFQNFVENLNIPAQVLASALKSASRRAQQKQFYANRKRDEARKKDEACQDRFSLSGYPREVIEAAAKGILGLQRTDILETRKMVEMLEVMGITRRDIDEFMREVCGQEFDDWSERPPRGSAGPRGRGRAESQGSGRVASQGRGRAASQGRGSTRRQPRSWEAEDAEDVEDMLSGGRSRRSRRQGPPFQGGRRVYADSDDFHRFHLGGEAAGGPWDEDFERRSREAHAAGLDVEDLEEFERHFGEGAFSSAAATRADSRGQRRGARHASVRGALVARVFGGASLAKAAPWVSHGYGGPGGGGEPFGSGAPAGREPDTEERVEAAMAEALARGWRPQELSRGQASRLLGVAAWGASAGELREARRRLVLRGGVVLDGPLGGPPGGLPPALMELMGPGAPEVLALGPGGPVLGASGDAGQPARIPADAFRELFPGPLVEVSEVESPDGTVVEFDSPFGGAPDPHVLDMLQGLGREFQSEMLPAIRKQASAGAWQAPLSCRDDLQKLCPGDKHRLACLGRHQDAVSEACRRDVGKSVPFLCSGEIEKFCTPASEGILPCLARSAGEASPACREAVAATRGLVGRARTQKAVVTNPATGEKKVHVPTAEPAAQRERRLDSQIAGRQAPSSTKAPQSAGVAAPSPELAALREANLDALLAGEPASPRPAQSGDEATASASQGARRGVAHAPGGLHARGLPEGGGHAGRGGRFSRHDLEERRPRRGPGLHRPA
ncbi:unnamed protein product, partial [Prorocentrum cordatum]